MKRLFYFSMLVIVTGIVIYACKKTNNNSNEFNDRLSANRRSSLGMLSGVCSQTLPSTISSGRTLNADTAYLITNCVKVQSGATLTIPAGTILFGQKSTKGTLIIERGAKLVVNGTSTNPVVFTSDQGANSRNPGDWGGIIIAGKASNNSASNIIATDRACGTITAGQASPVDADDSGSLSYMQIHYAGAFASGDEYPSALLLAAVGSNTDIDHIQITNSLKDGVTLRGGRVNMSHITNYDNYRTDFLVQDGYRGSMQYILSVRLNSNAHDATDLTSNAIAVRNNPINPSNTPLTAPVISNATILGPYYCGGSSLSGDFKYGIFFADNAAGGMFNSVIAGWPTGLFIRGDDAVKNANNGLLKFSYNTFYGFAADINRFNFSATLNDWDQPTGTCSETISDWIKNPLSEACANIGYQTLSSGLGYSSSICDSYCSGAPSFTLGSTSLNNASFPSGSMVDVPFFSKGTQPRGAFNSSSDWNSGWTSWCPVSTPYCM